MSVGWSSRDSLYFILLFILVYISFIIFSTIIISWQRRLYRSFFYRFTCITNYLTHTVVIVCEGSSNFMSFLRLSSLVIFSPPCCGAASYRGEKNHIKANFAAAQKLTAELHRERDMYELCTCCNLCQCQLPPLISHYTVHTKSQAADGRSAELHASC